MRYAGSAIEPASVCRKRAVQFSGCSLDNILARLTMIKFDHLIVERKNLSDYWQRMSTRKSYATANICTKIPASKLIRIIFALLFRS